MMKIYIPARVAAFHQNVSAEEFVQRQLTGRKLWKEKLAVAQILAYLAQEVPSNPPRRSPFTK